MERNQARPVVKKSVPGGGGGGANGGGIKKVHRCFLCVMVYIAYDRIKLFICILVYGRYRPGTVALREIRRYFL